MSVFTGRSDLSHDYYGRAENPWWEVEEKRFSEQQN